MPDEFKLPDIGEGLAEGEIVKWLVAVGDAVTEDQPLVEVMTDKATVEIPSPRAGVIEALPAGEGEIVAIGATILVFGEGAAAPPESEPESEPATQPESEISRDIEKARKMARAERVAVEAPADRQPWEAPPVAAGTVAPAARRLAAELGVEVAQVAGSGRGGMVTKEDVRAFAAAPPAAAGAPPVAAAPPPPPPTGAAAAATTPAGAGAASHGEQRVPLRGLRRTIAERMVLATTTVPHYTYVEEADMTEIVALRSQAKAKAAGRGVKLTFLPFVVRALVQALKEHPYLNASLDADADEIVLKRYYNIGIAANTERGLMVPVVKGADQRDLLDVATEISRLSDDARSGKIALEDLSGGTFTITSTGNIGGFLATPVINVPEVAILGITAIRERPVVRDGEIVVRHMVNLSLSCDHRVVDGAVAALFMSDLVDLLEDPKLQLLAGL